MHTAVGDRLDGCVPGRGPGRRRARARHPARRSSSAGCRSPRARTSAASRVLGRDVTVGAGTTIERVGRARRARDRRGLPPERLHRRRGRARRRRHARRGRRRPRRGRDHRRGQRAHGRGAYVPGRRRCPTERSRSELARHRGDLDSAAIAAVDSASQLADILSLPEQLRDALWRVESARARAVRRARRPGRRRHGRLGHRRSAGPRRAGRPAVAPDRPGARLRAARLGDRPTRPSCAASYSGDTEETLAAYEAAGRAGRAAGRGHDRRPSWPSWPARTACRSSRWPAATSRASPSPT